MFEFEILAEDSATGARAGRVRTPHGDFETPVFMPVGTKGAVRTMAPDDLEAVGAEIVLGNTYHLFVRPGPELVKEAGGLHNFMSWNRPILTDSGGYQVFSLESEVSDEGVHFKAPIDGTKHLLTPEKAIGIQQDLGADIIMVLDECPPFEAGRQAVEDAAARSVRWAVRCREAQTRPDQALFGIIQGGVHLDIRRASLEATLDLDFPGIAIGGLAVGEPKEEMIRVLRELRARLPEPVPRYLMGVGDPEALVTSVGLGIDMFDSAFPTRIARNGSVLTSEGTMNLRNSCYRKDFGPLDSKCSCYACTRFSRAYLRHLYTGGEILAHHMLTWHNLKFVTGLVKGARDAIVGDRFSDFVAGLKEPETSRDSK